MCPAVATGTSARRRALPRTAAAYLRSHRRLLWRSTLNEIRVRYAGSILGIAWVVLAPALLLTVYGLVYLEVYRIRTPGLGSTEFILYIFAGLVPFLMTAQALNEGSGALIDNPALLTSTVFPVDLAPVRAVLSTLPVLLVGETVVVIGSAATGRATWTLALLPLVILLQVLALVGIAWFLSLATVVARDVQHVITIVILVLLVASPIAYTEHMLHGTVRLLVYVNPLAWYVLAYQKILILGESPSPLHWAALIAAGVGLFFAGSAFFSWAKGVAMDYV
jgi:lipopolysaccharide transport system permease protein